jgi:GcrA cell cycle regulator
MHSEPWTVERIVLLRKLWSEGATAAAIADRLGGSSRSAVLGKIFRLRLHIAEPAISALGQSAAAGQAGATVVPVRRRRSRARNRRTQPAPPNIVQRKTLLELTNNTCRWPHGQPGTERFFFCGAPEADLEKGIPYCTRHMRRAYPAFATSVPSGAMSADGARRPSSGANHVDLRSLLLMPRAL